MPLNRYRESNAKCQGAEVSGCDVGRCFNGHAHFDLPRDASSYERSRGINPTHFVPRPHWSAYIGSQGNGYARRHRGTHRFPIARFAPNYDTNTERHPE